MRVHLVREPAIAENEITLESVNQVGKSVVKTTPFFPATTRVAPKKAIPLTWSAEGHSCNATRFFTGAYALQWLEASAAVALVGTKRLMQKTATKKRQERKR